jgi:hypothetical protein
MVGAGLLLGLGCGGEAGSAASSAVGSATMRVRVDRFDSQDWQPPEQVNAFVLKSQNGQVVTGVAFTDAEELPQLRHGELGPILGGDFAAQHDFLAVFGLPWVRIGAESQEPVTQTLIASKGLGGVSSDFVQYPGLQVTGWAEGQRLSGEIRIPYSGGVYADASYPPSAWQWAEVRIGQISLEFDGPYREWAGQPDTCYGPQQNLAAARSALSFGCACDAQVDVPTPCVTEYFDAQRTKPYTFTLFCDGILGQWRWGDVDCVP